MLSLSGVAIIIFFELQLCEKELSICFLVAIAQFHKEEDNALGIIVFFLAMQSMKRMMTTCWVCPHFFVVIAQLCEEEDDNA
jgi:hypothetical protein